MPFVYDPETGAEQWQMDDGAKLTLPGALPGIRVPRPTVPGMGGSVVAVPRPTWASPSAAPTMPGAPERTMTTLDWLRRSATGKTYGGRQARETIADEQAPVDAAVAREAQQAALRARYVDPKVAGAQVAGQTARDVAKMKYDTLRETAADKTKTALEVAQIKAESDVEGRRILADSNNYRTDAQYQEAVNKLASETDPVKQAQALELIREKARATGDAEARTVAAEMLADVYRGQAGLFKGAGVTTATVPQGSVDAVAGAGKSGGDLDANGVIDAAEREILDISNALVAGNWNGKEITNDVAKRMRDRMNQLKLAKGAVPKPAAGG